MRGEHERRVAGVAGAPGIIPAYAGSTKISVAQDSGLGGSSPHTRGARSRGRRRRPSRRDHPRIRGEHEDKDFKQPHIQGIIPAYAGSTLDVPGLDLVVAGSSPHTRGARVGAPPCIGEFRDHPRIRGEHRPVRLPGRPPRGIIPAYAGSTFFSDAFSQAGQGSSPHTRGAPTRRRCAGTRTRDHPRIRGEHREPRPVHAALDGIIPAYAGSTAMIAFSESPNSGSSPHTRGAPWSACAATATGTDHPRIRGEHYGISLDSMLYARIIPAYAGSTRQRLA